MNDVKLAHPSLDQLTAFGQGRLGESELAELAAHLGECAECREKVEATGDDTLVNLLRAADTEHDREDAKEPQEAVRPKLSHGPVWDYRREDTKNPQEAVTLAAPLQPSPMPGLPAELAAHGRYRVQELLGVGGMGAVYKAEHLLMERPVALKLISHSLTSNPAMVERFRREVKTAGQLKHANIVMAYDAEQAGDSHFLVMEYVEGKSLARIVTEQGPLPVREACDYIRQAALGLQHAHERGMVHRDIKPQNLMLTPDGQVKILDFGLARFAMEAAPTGALLVAPVTDAASASSASQTGSESLTQVGTVMGTPDYIAPEQAKDAHTADIRADVYSLGCTLYDLLAGHAPFPEGTVVAKVMAHIERTPKPLTELRNDVPPGLVRVVERMMAKDPAKRYQTPAEVADALKPFAAAVPVKPRRPIRKVAAGAVLGAAALILGGWIIFVQTDKGEFVIEASDKNIEAIVNAKGVKIRDAASGREYLLKVGSKNVRTGKYEIVSKLPDGVEIHGETFTVSRGGNVLVTARLLQKGEQPQADKDAKIAAAAKAAEAYLKTLDAGDYGRLWEQVAAWALQNGPNKEEIVRTYEWLTQQSGKLKSRTPANPQYLTALPGAPEGEFVLFGYNSSFERWDHPAVEQLVLMLEKDGHWRAVSYSRFATPGAPSVPQDVRADVPAVVGPAQARFVIPVPDKKVWSWYLPDTPANQEEYRWTVKVTNNGKSYSFGFSLYKRGGQKPASGTLAELLNAGQVNLWSSTKDGGAVIEGDARIRAEGNSVVVMINDRKLLGQLFSTRPPVVEFESGLPGDEKVTTRIVAVTYADASATATQGSNPDHQLIQGTWKGVSASVQGQQLPEVILKAIGPTITFAGNKVTWKATPAPEAKDLFGGMLAKFSLDGVFHLDPTKSPKTIDLTVLGAGAKTPLGTPAPRALLGIYKFNGDSLEFCIAIDPDHPEERPTKFASVPGKFIAHVILKRESANMLPPKGRLINTFGTGFKPITRDNIKEDDGGWRIETTKERVVRLYEVQPPLEDCLVTYRAKIKSANLTGKAYLEMWARFPHGGEFFSKGVMNPLSGTSDWKTFEAPFVLQKNEAPDLFKLNVHVEGAGTVWIKDIELWQAPLPPEMKRPSNLKPTEAGKVVTSFSHANKPISAYEFVKEDQKGWRIDAERDWNVPFFLVKDFNYDACMVTYRAQMKSSNLQGKAYLEMLCHFPGDPDKVEPYSRGLAVPLTGTSEWASYETPFALQKGQRPDRIKLNVVIEGKGTVWIKDIELLRGSLPK